MMLSLVVVATLQASQLPVQVEVRDGSRARSTPTASARAGARPKTSYRVVVDAGHGGVDPGAPVQGGKLAEKDITLQVALKVGTALRQRGIDVVYTRASDTLIARSDRGKIANQAQADVFVSIHVNAANPNWKQPQAARGFETYFLGVAKTEDSRRVEEMEEESGRFESGAQSTGKNPLDFIVTDMIQNEHLRESADLADIVQRKIKSVHSGPDRGVKQAGFTVLVSAFMPAILVEIGFGTNVEEARFISSASRQRQLADAIAEATKEFLQRHERRVGAAGASTDQHD